MTVKRSTLIAAALAGALGAGGTVLAIDLGRMLDVGKDLATASTGISEQDEIAVGKEIAGRMLGAAPLVADPALQAYVNRVGRWVAMQSERPDLPWRFGVIESPTINAFAAPGGYVLITRGLYEILDNESQLGGVLGHEVAHVVKRHHITVMQQSAAVSAGARLVQQNRNALVNNLIGTGAEVMARGLDKSAEFESDQMGVILAARAGYGPTGLVDVLQKLSARGASDASLALLFKTHPSPNERLTQLGDALAPRMPQLPVGSEPQIRQVSADAVPAAASKPIPGAGARALTQEETAPPPTVRPAQKGGGAGMGVDPSQVLRGIFGR